MTAPTRIEVRRELDRGVAAETGDLLARATAAEGFRPLGEHKHSQLRPGASDWTGVLAYDRDGRLVGYAHLRWSARGGEPRVALECVAHPPEGRDAVVTRLVEAAEAVVAEAGGGRAWLWEHRVADPRAALPARLGWRVQRDLAFMTRPLGDRPDPGGPPPGVELRPYRGEGDDEEFLRVNNAAFEGHPENGGWDRAEFAARRDRDWFDPQGLLMAWRGDELLGFHWTKLHPHGSGEVPGDGPAGEVYVLAVHPGAHGSGLGRSLLAAGLAHLADRGCRQAVLYVDTASAPAVRLYAAAGFTPVHHEVCYERDVAPAPGRAPAPR